MKNYYIIFLALFLSPFANKTFGQAPLAIPYQAVARDNASNPIINQAVALRFSIHDVTAGGTVLYSETQMATTNSLGLFSVNIGLGTVLTGTFASINWSANAKFLQVEIDVTGGSTFIDLGTQQMLSVPYSFYSSRSGGAASGDLSGNYPSPAVIKINGSPLGTTSGATNGQVLKWNGSNWAPGSDNNSGGTVTNVSASAPLTSSGGSTPSISLSGTIPVANGGTGTNSSFTSGSVVFAGGSGIYNQSNANLFWDNSNNRLGIGTNSPSEKLHILGNIRSSVLAGSGNRVVQSDASGNLTALSAGTASQVLLGTGVFGNVPTNTTWSLTGNSGIVDGTNFLGTTNNVALSFIVGNQKAGRIDPATGNGNAFLGYHAGNVNTTGLFNTAMGFDALSSHTSGQGNTAFGNSSLRSTTSSLYNTAVGFNTLGSNITGGANTAIGAIALSTNTSSDNSAVGYSSLSQNTTGFGNTAIGSTSLSTNSTGDYNVACGIEALKFNTSGFGNTATGSNTLQFNITGNNNTAVGYGSLISSTGSNNIALGSNAGLALTTGSNNIYIGNQGLSGDNNIIRIGTTGTHNASFISGVNGVTVAGAVPVLISASGQLGTILSSRRFKKDIADMDNASENIYCLRPVTFRYKEEFANGDNTLQYGLIAEETALVQPDLIATDIDGNINTVRYHILIPLMLNELQKEHALNLEQKATIEKLQAQIQLMNEDLIQLRNNFNSVLTDIQKLKTEMVTEAKTGQ